MIKKRTPGKMYYVRGTFTRENTDFFEDVMAMVNEGFNEVSIEPVVLEKGHPLALREEDLDEIIENLLDYLGFKNRYTFESEDDTSLVKANSSKVFYLKVNYYHLYFYHKNVYI